MEFIMSILKKFKITNLAIIFFLAVALYIGTQPALNCFENVKADDYKLKKLPSSERIEVERDGGIAVVSGADQGEAEAFTDSLGSLNDLYGHLHLGKDLMRRGEFRQAETEFNMVIKGVGGKSDAWMGHLALMQLYETEGSYEKALRECEYIIQNSSEYARPEYENKLNDLKLKAKAIKSLS